jgi:hypothetical protein
MREFKDSVTGKDKDELPEAPRVEKTEATTVTPASEPTRVTPASEQKS